MDDRPQLVRLRRGREVRVALIQVSHLRTEAIVRDQQGLGQLDFIGELRSSQPRRVGVGRSVAAGGGDGSQP